MQTLVDDDLDVRRYTKVAWQHRYLIAGVTTVAIAVAVVSVLRAGPRYQASAVLSVSTFREAVPGFVMQAGAATPANVDDLVGEIDNDGVAARVIEQASATPSLTAADLLKETQFTSLKPYLVRLTVTDPSAVRAAVLARAWSAMIPRYVDSLWHQELQRTLLLLEPRLQAAREAWMRADDHWRKVQAGPGAREAAGERDATKNTYLMLAQQVDQIRLLAAGSSGVVAVAVPATPAGTPVPTRGIRRVVFAAMLGLAVGFVAAFAVEQLSRDPSC